MKQNIPRRITKSTSSSPINFIFICVEDFSTRPNTVNVVRSNHMENGIKNVLSYYFRHFFNYKANSISSNKKNFTNLLDKFILLKPINLL